MIKLIHFMKYYILYNIKHVNIYLQNKGLFCRKECLMNHISRPVRYIALSILAAVLFSVSGCNKERKKLVLSKYDGPYSAVNGSYGGVDDLGRELLTDTEAGGVRQGKTVGIFYFLCLGTQGTNHVYDVQKILEKDPTAYRSEEAWLSAGGGAVGTPHWWSEPLFNYYTQTDEWVIRKHIQMFSAAGIDYLMLDTSNGTPNTYLRQGQLLLQLLDEYAKMGYSVPKIAYYTNAVSGKTMDEIYEQIYLKYPQYQYLWFQWDGKPLMVGKAEEASEAVKNTFRIKASQWPNEEKNDDGSLNSITLFGGGIGHGAGMSQNGVKTMADNGEGVEEIIKTYYKNTELKKMY